MNRSRLTHVAVVTALIAGPAAAAPYTLIIQEGTEVNGSVIDVLSAPGASATFGPTGGSLSAITEGQQIFGLNLPLGTLTLNGTDADGGASPSGGGSGDSIVLLTQAGPNGGVATGGQVTTIVAVYSDNLDTVVSADETNVATLPGGTVLTWTVVSGPEAPGNGGEPMPEPAAMLACGTGFAVLASRRLTRHWG